MSLRRVTAVAAGLFAAAGLCAPSEAAGFALFTQGAKAMGMGDGAFVAQADDGSAIFYNVAGLGFQRDRSVQLGGTLIIPGDAEFEGGLPFPGPTQRGDLERSVTFPIHLYYVEPLDERWTFGLGLHAPFGLRTQWEDPDNFSGRFLSYVAEITVFDVNPSVGVQVSDTLSLGVGAVGRISTWSQRRRIGVINPFNNAAAEVADVRLRADVSEGLGWNAGLLHVPNDWFRWGLSYRSRVEVEYDGDAFLVQRPSGDALFDLLVRASLPFGESPRFENEIDFPAIAMLGLAFQVSPRALVETDINWFGWDSFRTLDVTFPSDPSLDVSVAQDFEDSFAYRAAVRIDCKKGRQWRFGYAFDESPQPSSSISPLLADADRDVFSAGWGTTGRTVDVDVALLYVDLGRRTTLDSNQGFNGTYESDALLAGLTLGF